MGPIAQASGLKISCLLSFNQITVSVSKDGVKDGDTLCVNLNAKGMRASQGYQKAFRIKGINAAEIHGKNRTLKEKALALAALERVYELVGNSEQVEVSDVEIEKYGRLLGHVHVDGKRIAKILLDEKLVVPYDGGQRTETDWETLYDSVDPKLMHRLLRRSEEGAQLVKALKL